MRCGLLRAQTLKWICGELWVTWENLEGWLVPNGPAGGKTLELLRVSHCCQQWLTCSLTTCMSQCTLHKSAVDTKLEGVAETPMALSLFRGIWSGWRNVLRGISRRSTGGTYILLWGARISAVHFDRKGTHGNMLLDTAFSSVHSTCKSGTITINTKRHKCIIYKHLSNITTIFCCGYLVWSVALRQHPQDPVGLSMYEFRVKCITAEIVYKGDIYSLNRGLSSCGYQLQRSCKDCNYAAVSRARYFHVKPCSTNRVLNRYENSSNKKLTSSPRQCDLHCKTEVLTLPGKFQQTNFFLSKTCCACHPISKTIMKRCRNGWEDRFYPSSMLFFLKRSTHRKY